MEYELGLARISIYAAIAFTLRTSSGVASAEVICAVGETCDVVFVGLGPSKAAVPEVLLHPTNAKERQHEIGRSLLRYIVRNRVRAECIRAPKIEKVATSLIS